MAADGRVVVGSRDATDHRDVFTALDLNRGLELWAYTYDAPASLDYGKLPRATPGQSGGVVVTLGATGILSGLDATTGVPLWTVDLPERFAAELPTWGFSGSPLVIEGVIYVQVGESSSLVAIDLFSGETKWQVAGAAPAYASLVSASGGQQIVGVDDSGYFVRRAADGKMLWSRELRRRSPATSVCPSPVVAADGVIFTAENNGVQWFPVRRRGLSQKSVRDQRCFDSGFTHAGMRRKPTAGR